MTPDQRVACCIAGCGPAGAMLGLLLARAGLEVVVLEKHADFLRDFRGDTIHPSTLEIMDELRLADQFLQLPHVEVRRIAFRLPNADSVGVDFTSLHTRFPFIAFVPQWDFLDFVTQEAARYDGFRLVMEAEVQSLLEADGQVCGLQYRTPEGAGEVRAALTVGADGRSSVTRAAARLPLVETSPPMDVVWFRLSRRPDEPENPGLNLTPGHFAAVINRRDYWQVAWAIPKGDFEHVRQAGLDAFRGSVASTLPALADRVTELQDWEQLKLLTVRADRLRRWYRPGYLAIGDAAHAMSPIAGVGINIAIQDAVEAANLLWRPLRQGRVTTQELARVQRRRELPVRLTQTFQALLQDQVLKPTLSGHTPALVPAVAGWLLRAPLVRNVPARLLGFGLWRPHVHTLGLALQRARPAGR